MTIWYVAPTGDDDNGGTTDNDSPVVAGTVGDVDNPSSGFFLTDASKDFVAAGVVEGDAVNVVSGDSGIITGVHLIIAVAVTELTLATDPGDSALAGDVVYNVGGRFATIQAAVDEIADDSIVKINPGTYAEMVSMSVEPLLASPAIIEGVGVLATDVVIDGENTRANCIIANGNRHYLIRNLTVERATASGIFAPQRWSGEFLVIRNNGTMGWQGGGSMRLMGCEAYGNGEHGFYNFGIAAFCYSHDNTLDGFRIGNIIFCVSEKNAQSGIGNFRVGSFIVNCVLDSNRFGVTSNREFMVMVNNIISNNTEWGIFGGEIETEFEDYNLFYNNASGDRRAGSLGPNDITGQDPQFVDAANGDFRVELDSPARGVGFTQTEDPPGLGSFILGMGAIQVDYKLLRKILGGALN